MILRVFWKVVGERVRLRVFAAMTQQPETFREVGVMVVSGEEFLDLTNTPLKTELYEEDEDADQPTRTQ